MEFNNRLYRLRKQHGLSQEELAGRLNVSRQTVSKWEVGDSTPDMEKLAAMSDLFGVSLDMLVLGREDQPQAASAKPDLVTTLSDKVLTAENKEKAARALKIAGIIAAAILIIDVISMIIYFAVNGMPQ